MCMIVILTAWATVAINLVGMKLLGLTDLSWLWVLFPYWAPAVSLATFLACNYVYQYGLIIRGMRNDRRRA